MAELKELKVYVLTTKNSDRLINGLPKDYPSILPKPELVYGMTPDDVDLPMPDWYSRKKYNIGSWCCARSKLKLFKQHYEQYPNSDIMFVEDDAVFNIKFNPMYECFIKDVPDDWGMIFLGGKFCVGTTRVTELAARVFSIVNNECFIVKADVVPKIIEVLDLNARHVVQASDQAIASLMMEIPTYIPLVRFAGQRSIHSNIRNKFRSGTGSKITNKPRDYVDFDGTHKLALFNEALLYFKDYMKTATVDIPVYGGIGNCLFFIAFGRWLRTFGITVNFYDDTRWGQQTLDFLNDIGEPVLNKKIRIKFGRCSKEQALYKCLIHNRLVTSQFYPELRHFIHFDKIALKPIIGVNVRRGDFLSRKYKNKRPDFYDLCERRYYHNAAKIARKLGLPVRIISDEPDKIPKEIIDLFDNPELMHGTFKEDFYNLAECKYKFISNSTFAYWAAYAAPDATVFYPKGCRDDIKLDEWTPLELTDMSDEELEKITPKEEKSE